MTNTPLAVFLHGLFRSVSEMQDWPDRLAGQADVLLLGLPGHGSAAPATQPTLENLALAAAAEFKHISEGRRTVLIGESFGGLIALKIAQMGLLGNASVVAIDPPMSTSKLWPVQSSIKRTREKLGLSTFAEAMVREVFGVTPDSPEIEHKTYFDLLEGIDATIITGDVPLFPPRMALVPPCLFDDDDRYWVARSFPNISIEIVKNAGHVVLQDQPARCAEIIGAKLS